MAVSTSSYFSNSAPGMPETVADLDIFRQDSTPRHPLGTRVLRQDGNVYVYSHFGDDVNRGVLVATDVSESSRVDSNDIIVAPASANNTNDGTLGSKFVEITLASVTDDQFAGGYFITTDDTGEGYTYRIKGNNATGDPASGNFRLELYDKLQVAVDATTDFCIQGNLYANLEIAVDGTDDCLAGVTVATMDVSAAAYGWVCVKGVVGILADAQTTAIAIGDTVTLSSEISGAVMILGEGATAAVEYAKEEIVGTCLIAPDDTGHGAFKVNIS